MTVHYSVESLSSLFLSDKFISDKNSYKQSHKLEINSLERFLDSIEINKQYFRTGIHVKNPKYKKKVYDDTGVIKQLKSSLNKMSGLTYKKLSEDICKQLDNKTHLYPILLQYIFEQSLCHHTYCSYYAHLVEQLHNKYNNEGLILSQINKTDESINKTHIIEADYASLCEKNKQTDQLIGFSIFITELELKGIIQGKVDKNILSLIDKLTSDNDDELYKCLVCLYNIFKVLYKDSDIFEGYKVKLTIIKDSTTVMKVKFKIMDILERR
jgi:hypothetical protein